MKCSPFTHSTFSVPLTDSIGALSQQFPLRQSITSPRLGSSSFVEAGGLMAYGANRLEASHRAAVFVDKILKGAKPGNLPVEQSMRFDLVINLKAAKALAACRT